MFNKLLLLLLYGKKKIKMSASADSPRQGIQGLAPFA